MRKIKSKKARREKQDKIDKYNIENYLTDLDYVAKLNIPDYRKDWIVTTMYELRDKANIYERKLGNLLINKGIRFIHQAPFVFYGKKIYFADFFIPRLHLVIEVDGQYHQGFAQGEYDAVRDKNFADMGIKTARISNNLVKDDTSLNLYLETLLKGHN